MLSHLYKLHVSNVLILQKRRWGVQGLELGFEHRSIEQSGSKAHVLAAVTVVIFNFLMCRYNKTLGCESLRTNSGTSANFQSINTNIAYNFTYKML